jgi:hypothetical protein
MGPTYKELLSIKRATLKREALADAEQSAYLKFGRPTEAVTHPPTPQPPRPEKPTLRQH